MNRKNDFILETVFLIIAVLSFLFYGFALGWAVRDIKVDQPRYIIVETHTIAPKTLSQTRGISGKAVEPKPLEAKLESVKAKQVKARSDKNGTYTITFYCPCEKCCGKTDGITASGIKAAANRTVAAPKNFAFGEQIRIEGLGHFVVEDRGGSIKGNRLDVFVDSHEEALKLGVQTRKVEMVND